MAAMEPPFRIQADLQRVFDRGHAFALGVAGGATRPPAWGWSRIEHIPSDDHPASLTWTIVVSHEVLRPLLMELFRLLPEQVTGILELGSRDAFRAVDVFLSRHAVQRHQFRGAWDLFEPVFLEDASLAVGVNGDTPFIELFLDQDKRLVVHGEPATAPALERVLRRFGLDEQAEADIIVPDTRLDATQTRPVLEERLGFMVDIDQILVELRAAWDLELDDDPERNLDAQGRDIGRTLWNGVVLIDQEDIAGRREAHGHFWGVASSRRDMEERLLHWIEAQGEWEVLDVVGMDRSAYDNRPQELNALPPHLPTPGVLAWRVDPIGTVPDWDDPEADWTGDERF